MIIFICGFLGCIIGVLLTNKHKNKYLFYKELNDFFSYIKHSISFSQKLIKEITIDFYGNRKKHLFNYDEYLDYLNSKRLDATFDIKESDFLTKNEKKEVVTYFSQLGKLNLNAEIEKLEEIISAVNTCKEEKKEEFKKYSNIFIKLGILFGLGVGIILV